MVTGIDCCRTFKEQTPEGEVMWENSATGEWWGQGYVCISPKEADGSHWVLKYLVGLALFV